MTAISVIYNSMVLKVSAHSQDYGCPVHVFAVEMSSIMGFPKIRGTLFGGFP